MMVEWLVGSLQRIIHHRNVPHTNTTELTNEQKHIKQVKFEKNNYLSISSPWLKLILTSECEYQSHAERVLRVPLFGNCVICDPPLSVWLLFKLVHDTIHLLSVKYELQCYGVHVSHPYGCCCCSHNVRTMFRALKYKASASGAMFRIIEVSCCLLS